MTLIGNYFGRAQAPAKQKNHSLKPLPAIDSFMASNPDLVEDEEAPVHFLAPPAPQETTPGDELSSLMNAVKDQALQLKCEQAKVISDWQIGLELLTSRMATLQPLLSKTLHSNADREQTITRLAASETELKRRLAENERELSHYRPMALQLDDELRNIRAQLTDSQRHAAGLEAEHAKSQGAINDLFQKAATAEAARQRVIEENAAYSQKLREHDNALQSFVREAAQLRGELVSSDSDVERLEAEIGALTKKFANECEEHSRVRAIMETLQTQFSQLQKESLSRVKEAEERERRATEMLSAREKQYYDLDVRQSALLSKVDFLSRTNQRQRDDLRRHIDHIGNLESSNRQLLDALARNANGSDSASAQDESTQQQAPKLRAVAEVMRAVNEDPELARQPGRPGRLEA